jgi:GT2 family glycosyltransferase
LKKNLLPLSVSIVIPNYNGRKLLEKHLPHVVENAEGNEVIVVDDASTDDSVVYLKKNFPQIKVVQLRRNSRYAAACNAGVEEASGDIIMLLNNDVSPQQHYLKPLLSHFADPNIFAVGCAEKSSMESTEISGRGCGGFARGMMVHWRCEDQKSGPSLWVSGGSGAFRKIIWNQLGGMDPLFAPAYEEDRDLCYRALKRGFTIMFEKESMVIHQHETTNQRVLGKSDMAISSYKNQFLIVWKNITSTRLLMAHVLWLPYHLVVGGLRTQGQMARGFLAALSQLPAIIPKRRVESRDATVSDADVFAI